MTARVARSERSSEPGDVEVVGRQRHVDEDRNRPVLDDRGDVVGNPAATVITSSPGRSRAVLHARAGERAAATRLALLPLFTSRACGRSYQCASSASKLPVPPAGGQPELERRSRRG